MPSKAFPASNASPRAARRFVMGQLEERAVTERVRTVAGLLVSELVTNAVLHTHSAPVVSVAVQEGMVHVEVCDASTRLPVLDAHTTAFAPRGHGLVLVDRLSRQWGVDRRRGGKAVWFEVAVANGA